MGRVVNDLCFLPDNVFSIEYTSMLCLYISMSCCIRQCYIKGVYISFVHCKSSFKCHKSMLSVIHLSCNVASRSDIIGNPETSSWTSGCTYFSYFHPRFIFFVDRHAHAIFTKKFCTRRKKNNSNTPKPTRNTCC